MKLIRNVLVLLAGISTPLMLSACSGADPATEAEETGTLQANLTGTSTSGIQYRLRYAQFEVNGGPMVFTSFSSESYLGQTQALVTLPSGQYTVGLYGSWVVERDNMGTFTAVQAALVSPNPTAFQVNPNQTTGVTFAFNVNGEIIQFGDGALSLSVTFDDTPTEDSWSRCTDGIDNDADTLIDCGDPSCVNLGFCGGQPENHPAVCMDGIDNDFDGWVDCQDPECVSAGVCGISPEADPVSCSDGMDNDVDGLFDCQDPECVGLAVCGAPVENDPVGCGDHLDNDGDGLIDCADLDCLNNGNCGWFESNPQRCSDGLDTDGDGLFDCQDPECTTTGACGVVFEDTAQLCSDGFDNDMDGSADCNDQRCVNSGFCFGQMPNPGSVIISEIMYNPAIVSDVNGEWLEIQNTGPFPIDLMGCQIQNTFNGSMDFIMPGGVIPVGGYGVIAHNTDPALNGGVLPLAIAPAITLGNGGATLQLICNGLVIDEVSYDNLNFSANGASIQLRPGEMDNDFPFAWCLSTYSFGMGDRGTPGTANTDCP